MGISSFPLHLNGLLGYFVETLGILGGLLGGVQGDRVVIVVVRIDGEKDRADVGLKLVCLLVFY